MTLSILFAATANEGTQVLSRTLTLSTSILMRPNARKTKSTSSFPRDIIAQAKTVKQGWRKVGKRLDVPNLSLQKFLNKLVEAQESVDKAEQLKLERAEAIQDRNKCLSELWDLTKRIRNAAKATFGDHSSELDLLVNPKDTPARDCNQGKTD